MDFIICVAFLMVFSGQVCGELIFSSPPILKIISGDNVTIDCRYEGSDPFIVWKFTPKNQDHSQALTRGSRILDSVETTLMGQARVDGDLEYTSNLTLINVNWQIHDGVYECSNLDGRSAAHATEVQVKVPPYDLEVVPTQVRLEPGDRLELNCSVLGRPTPTITWTREDAALPSGEGSIANPVFSVDKVTKRDGGIYACRAFNGYGDTVGAKVKVEVSFPPEVFAPETLLFSGPKKRDVNMVCVFDAYPRVDLQWFADGVDVSTLSHMSTKSEVDSDKLSTKEIFSLVIELVQQGDLEKNYTCVGKSSMGEAAATITLRGVPMVVQIVSPKLGVFGNKYTIQFNATSYSPLYEFQLTFTMVEGRNVTDREYEVMIAADADQMGPVYEQEYTIEGLQPESTYKVYMRARNMYGNSSLSQPFWFTTNKAGATAPPSTTMKTTTIMPTTTPLPMKSTSKDMLDLATTTEHPWVDQTASVYELETEAVDDKTVGGGDDGGKGKDMPEEPKEVVNDLNSAMSTLASVVMVTVSALVAMEL